MKAVFAIALVMFSAASAAQNNPCSSTEASAFDFWVGDWELTWSDSLHGFNRIEKLYGNCAVHENFSDPARNYLGQSWTVYNANYKTWQQTWIDNRGGYIHLSGNRSGDSMILFTEERAVPVSVSPTGRLKNRMVFYNIGKDSFDWSWESSGDGGGSWTPAWQIHYRRKKE